MRLELIQDYYIIYPNKFQFHKGAIRTESARVEAEKKRDFNSIKVRLEPSVVPMLTMVVNDFNSIKVRLELL